MDESGKPSPEPRKRGAPFGNERALGNRGGGRKTVYSPRMAIVARKCCERGMIDIEVADMLGIGLATLYRWKAEHPAFSRAFKLGKAEADDRVERSLYSRAVGYDYIAEKAAMTRHGQKTMRYRAHIPPILRQQSGISKTVGPTDGATLFATSTSRARMTTSK